MACPKASIPPDGSMAVSRSDRPCHPGLKDSLTTPCPSALTSRLQTRGSTRTHITRPGRSLPRIRHLSPIEASCTSADVRHPSLASSMVATVRDLSVRAPRTHCRVTGMGRFRVVFPGVRRRTPIDALSRRNDPKARCRRHSGASTWAAPVPTICERLQCATLGGSARCRWRRWAEMSVDLVDGPTQGGRRLVAAFCSRLCSNGIAAGAGVEECARASLGVADGSIGAFGC